MEKDQRCRVEVKRCLHPEEYFTSHFPNMQKGYPARSLIACHLFCDDGLRLQYIIVLVSNIHTIQIIRSQNEILRT